MEFIQILIYFSIYSGLVATTFFVLSFISDTKKRKLLFEDDELPFVSVVIPAYNEEESIASTIESVLKSDYPNFEILVIDDGSKDNTFKIAKRFESKKVRVFSKENGGKGTALNFGISKATGEIIFTMDADTFVEPFSMKNMTRYFKDSKVMSVTPSMVVYKPKSILQRIQSIEYILGLFLRKAFAALNSIYIAPGAFSAYRKSFFEKYGGYDVDNITEDLEMALRIQFKGYVIENSPDSPAYTIAPRKFKHLLNQRVRWYYGLMKNLSKYRKIISPKYGDLGVFVIPVAILSVVLSVFITSYFFVKTLFDVQKELLFLQNINFDISSVLHFSWLSLERTFFLFFTNPVILFIFVFMLLFLFYISYASKKIGKIPQIYLNLPLFFLGFALLFGFWWVVSLVYTLFDKSIKWK